MGKRILRHACPLIFSFRLGAEREYAHSFGARNADAHRLSVNVLFRQVLVIGSFALNHETFALVNHLNGLVAAGDNENFVIVHSELGCTGFVNLSQSNHIVTVELTEVAHVVKVALCFVGKNRVGNLTKSRFGSVETSGLAGSSFDVCDKL